jgi:hypothetical protein
MLSVYERTGHLIQTKRNKSVYCYQMQLQIRLMLSVFHHIYDNLSSFESFLFLFLKKMYIFDQIFKARVCCYQFLNLLIIFCPNYINGKKPAELFLLKDFKIAGKLSPDIVIIRLMLSDLVWPKVITLSGAYCIC